jgi:hypothetical protein
MEDLPERATSYMTAAMGTDIEKAVNAVGDLPQVLNAGRLHVDT